MPANLRLKLDREVKKIIGADRKKVIRRNIGTLPFSTKLSEWCFQATSEEIVQLRQALGMSVETFRNYLYLKGRKVSAITAIRFEIAAQLIRSLRPVHSRHKLPRLSRWEMSPNQCGQCKLAKVHHENLQQLDFDDACAANIALQKLRDEKQDILDFLQKHKSNHKRGGHHSVDRRAEKDFAEAPHSDEETIVTNENAFFAVSHESFNEGEAGSSRGV